MLCLGALARQVRCAGECVSLSCCCCAAQLPAIQIYPGILLDPSQAMALVPLLCLAPEKAVKVWLVLVTLLVVSWKGTEGEVKV